MQLKLYAKWLDPNPRITSDYHAEAANLDMLENYGYEDNSVVQTIITWLNFSDTSHYLGAGWSTMVMVSWAML